MAQETDEKEKKKVGEWCINICTLLARWIDGFPACFLMGRQFLQDTGVLSYESLISDFHKSLSEHNYLLIPSFTSDFAK